MGQPMQKTQPLSPSPVTNKPSQTYNKPGSTDNPPVEKQRDQKQQHSEFARTDTQDDEDGYAG